MVEKYRLENGTFICSGEKKKILYTNTEQHSQLWLEKQKASVEEYKVTHTEEGIDTRTKVFYKLFKAHINDFIYSTYGDMPINVLDVGCGTFTGFPSYMRKTKKITYIGLDPEEINPMRDYLFIQGMVENLYMYLHDNVKFNIFLFSTSLDHIENIEECIKSIRKVAGPSSYCIFFLGLRDVKIVAEQVGGDRFQKIYSDMDIGKIVIRLIRSTVLMPLSLIYFVQRNIN